MIASGFDDNVRIYARRRAALFELLDLIECNDAVVILMASFEEDYGLFRQESSFYYLT